MNLSNKIMTLAATVALSAGVAFPSPADGTRANRGEAREARMLQRHGGRLAQALDLTDAQKAQAKAIREKHRTSNQALRAELKEINQQIRTARQANNIAEAQRLAALREPLLARAHQAWQAERAELKSVLTAEQQTKLEELQKSFLSKRQQRRG